ncbi:DUF4199 domain-containing protein [Prevotella corporis]|jgi:hypothetical protein|uniref:DUF4199 domain-containing protein n=1 Tax=Prevotella corporis TaxID=28128 RepID=UPI0023F056AE|nr:DUF4199 domain-containing protein [Prevotella corporis]
MNYTELRQLRAFSWYDGIYLAIIWTVSFGCFLASTWQLLLGDVSSAIVLLTPLFVGLRLRQFRDNVWDGIISFKNAFFYCMRMFFNAAWLFSLAQLAYMVFIDHGKMLRIMNAFSSTPEFQEMLHAMEIDQQEFLDSLPDLFQPYPLVVNCFVNEIILGAAASLVIAAILARNVNTTKQFS